MPETPSLYRRHRPRSFDEVVGQEHVVRTLRNAVQQGKVHHAYLFVGSRGTGKTSMAKILAACLNCEQGPTISPCGVCESCVAIANATSLDVIEMDAASNNSVDDIRDLRERVGYAPVSGRHKVYILDEAHMLSSQAWNAFLKTLEEPPPNTIFVLATTEAQRVLPTVVDRCHRFDFGRPSVEQIAAVLRRSAQSEGIVLPDEAIGVLARSATGSFRDALGTLEQLVTYSGDQIALEDVLAVLGVVDAELLFGVVDAVVQRDPRRALLAAAELQRSGRDAMQFLRDLEQHGRELLIARTLGEVPIELHMTAERDARLLAQAGQLAPADLTRLLDLLAAAQDAVKFGSDARVQLELALVKAAQPEADPTTQALLARVERLETRLAAGTKAVAPSAPAPAPTPVSPPPPAPSPPAPTPPPVPEPAPPTPTPPTPTPPTPAPPTPAPPTPAPPTPAPPAPAPAPGPPVPQPQPQPTPPAPPPSPVPPPTIETPAPEAPPRPIEPTPPEPNPGPAPAAAVAIAEPAPEPQPAPEVGPGGEIDLEQLRASWPAVLDTLKVERGPLMAGIFAEAWPTRLANGELTLAFPASATFKKRKADGPAYSEALSGAVRSVTGAQLLTRCELTEDAAEMPPAVAANEQALSDDELIERFMAEFDAEEIPPDEENEA